MRAIWTAAVVLALLLAAVGLVGLAVRRSGLSARHEPSSLESALARRVRHFAVPPEARARRNPLALDGRVLADARVHFADHCAVCHAADGSGDTPIGRRLYPRAPDMRQPATQRLSDGELFYIIENGVRLTGMPGWGGADHERDTWALVHFIRHLSRLTPEEALEVERLTPKTPEAWRELQEDERFLGGEGEPPEPAPPAGHAPHH